MALALALARSADYRTSPNPMVGAVVLDAAGAVAGEGFHAAPGLPHAERVALERAGARARGGTIYSSLEPCRHQGRTPPCTDAIIEAGIRRVVTAILDPDPNVSGQGAEALRQAGIEVDLGVLAAEAERLNEFYLKQRRTGLPFVTAKFASSLDGKIATRTGESRWITGEAARTHAHQLRHMHDAVVVGIRTVIQDDPALSARSGAVEPRQPLRVVVDSSGRTPVESRLLKEEGGPVLIATTDAAPAAALVGLREAGAEVVVLPTDELERVDIDQLLQHLGARPLLSVLVEGGGELLGSFFEASLVDKLYAYIAPMVIGGVAAPGPVGGEGITSIQDALRLGEVETVGLGDDILISGYVHRDS
jgi:diaminohydroxyphosphoribosylaminopyrimidine deaminase/5-amino-6-(5-phosphoribosylamino)uracil reductase